MGLCGSTQVAAPPPRDVAKEQSDSLLVQMQAQRGTGPFESVGSLLNLERDTRPGWIDLDLQSLQQTLGGSENQRGLMDIYEQDLYPALNRIESQSKMDRAAGDQAVLDAYGKQTTDALRKSSGNDRIMDLLRTQAEDELNQGGNLTAGEQREYQQAARQAQASRGMGYGQSDAFMEALQLGQMAEARKRQRQQFGQSVAGQLQATGGDPMLSLLGRPSQSFSAGQGFGQQGYGMSQNLGPQLFNPESAYSADAYRSNQQAALAASTATAANNASVTGGLISGLGSLGGGLLQGAGAAGGFGKLFCWVAREVYGVENPQWIRFRDWMTLDSPRWFYHAYLEHGKSVAAWLRHRPVAKAIVRRWMDWIIARRAARQEKVYA